MKTPVPFLLSRLLLPALAVSACLFAAPVRADETAQPSHASHKAPHVHKPLVIRAQGHARYAEFLGRSSKRADLRHNIHRKGVDVAFTEWLRHEHNHVYRQHENETKSKK